MMVVISIMLVMMALGASDANHDGVLTMMVGMLLMISTCKTWSALSLEGGGMSGAPCLLSQHLGNYNGDGDDNSGEINDDVEGGGDDEDGQDVPGEVEVGHGVRGGEEGGVEEPGALDHGEDDQGEGEDGGGVDQLHHRHRQAAQDHAEEAAVLLSEVDQEGLDKKAESENQSIRLFWKK